MRRTALATALVSSLALMACSPTTEPAPAPAQTASPTPGATATATPGETPTADVTPSGFEPREVAVLSNPWAMAFLPGTNQLLITQKSGELLLRDQESGATITVEGTPQVVDAGQGGFGDVVPGPTYEQDHTIYLSWVEQGDGGESGAVIGRARLESAGTTAQLVDLSVIWRQDKTTGNGHFSHRMAFSSDGTHLFVSSGDRQKMEPAQDLSTNLGKILRLNPDGSPADGNPFADRGGVSAEIWSYGHRNPLGIAFDADGNLWSSEMGPQGGDEINLIVEGRNYGWPRASNGSHYGGGEIPDHAPGDGFEPPKVWWTPSVSPGSLMIYSGDTFPQWQGDAFVGALSGQALIRVDLDGTEATKGDQWDMGQRIRDVAQGPDGSIWVIEDGGNGRLLELAPTV
ncbi:PQQ-dependent sugar dehydrogenase [Granulicoccus sp. GXG6511]|uniref:PQQ-dependent sugar dehydrogenase n=1 Tax=Granulicoccus sp. GXG6511 TaxID=3381351 RepID=UPI003D7DFB4F